MTAIQNDSRQAVLAESVREIRRLRAELAAAELARTEPIAIVGMACRMPGGAENPREFWDFLDRGGDGITDVPASRWDVEHFYDPSPDAPGKTYTRRGGFLSNIDQFDAAFFGISPREAASLDPQQRLLLEVGWEALEDAGQSPDALAGTSAGVFFGITNYDYCQRLMQQVDPAALEAYSLTSNASTFAAGRLSYWLGLSGPSLSVDTACSSSLVGLHLACQSLRSGESSLALAGGVNVLLSPEWYVVLSRARMLAPDGRCKTFDAAADGYVRSEGCGIVVLKRLADAVRHGDRILAVIRGSAVNQDGRGSGITVPNAGAQQDVVRRALRAASVAPADVGYVEAHGTGTPLGDPIELRALAAVLGDQRDTGPLLVGSVKTNIGHLEPAAGIAGLLKVVLALQHEQIPPHLHLTTVNPDLPLDELGMEIPTSARPWPRGGTARVAGVSSFGASGTNAHVIVEEAPTAPPISEALTRRGHLLTLSAKSAAALTALMGRYEERLRNVTDDELADICFTASVGRAHFPHRLAILASSPEEMRARLAAVTAGDELPSGVWRGHAPPGSRPRVAFLFTGQGAQYADMARGLYETELAFRAVLDHCCDVLGDLLERPLLSVLFPSSEDAELVHETRYTQPALFAVEYALAQLWRSWGIEPAAVLGHSVGELVAACLAGVLSVEDGLRLATRRGHLMHDLGDGGTMASVFAAPEVVRQALVPFAAVVSIAAVNGPESVVVSGEKAALDALLPSLAAQGVRSRPIAVHRAFHSPLVEPMLDAFERAAAEFHYVAPEIPLVSNLTGTVVRGDNAVTARYLREHARRPVQFLAGMNTLFEQGYRTFVEVGPAPTLLGLAGRFAPADADGKPCFLPSLRPRHDDHTVLLGSLGALYALGHDVNWTLFHDKLGRRRVALPSYPFQRSRHWFRPSARLAVAPAVASVSPSLLGCRIASPLETIQFESQLSSRLHPCLADCVIDGLPVVNIGFYLEAAFAAARELSGPGPVVVEDCLVRQRLVLDPDETKDVQLVLVPQGDDRAAYRYYAAHAEEDGGTRWVLHAQGAVRLAPAGDVPGTLDPDTVRARCGEQLSGADFYRQMWRRRLYIGPSAQWVEHVWCGADEALGRMRVPQPGEAESYLLPPGLTDAMFQLLFACLPAESPADASFMLVAIERFSFLGYDPAAPLFCHAFLSPSADPTSTLAAQVALYDAGGRLVAEASGVHLKRVDHIALQRVSVPARETPTLRPADSPRRAGAVRGHAYVPDLLRRIVARALGVGAADLDVQEPLPNCGLDSLMALEIKDALSAELGVALPIVAFLEGRSVEGLCEVVWAALGTTTETGPADPAVPPRSGGDRPALRGDPAARYEPFVLTDLQQAYLVGRTNAFELGNVSTYFFLEVDLEDVDLGRLAAAWRQMIARHDMLRAVVSPDGYQQVLADVPPYDIRTVDLRDCGDAERTRRLASIHDEMGAQVFDTATWPLFDVRATRIDERCTRLHLGLDALIIDAWSTSLLFREWAGAYRGDTSSPSDLPVTYRDYVLAMRALDGSEEHRRALEYWRSRIPTLPPAPQLPLAQSPAGLTRPKFNHRSDRLTAQEWSHFKSRAAAAGVTPSAALCTAYSQVLAVWSKSDHFTLTVLFFNRLPLHPKVGDLVGNFSATTLLEVHSVATEGFAVRAVRIQKQLWNDLDHSQVSGVEVLRELNRARGSTGRATMPVVFASTVNFAAKDDNSKDDNAAATGVAAHLTAMGSSGREVSSSIRTPQVWLDHQVVEDAGALKINWDVLEELFPVGMVDAMFTAYLGVLHELCDDEQAWTRPAPVLVPATDLDHRRSINATSAPLSEGLLHGDFVRTAATTPDRVAVIGVDRTLTYGELDGRSNQLDRWLRGQGVGPGALVGVVMEKGWEQIAAVLGILKSGAAYVPIDAAVPPERLRLLLANSGISVVLTQTRVDECTAWPDGVARLAFGGPGVDGESMDPLPDSGAAPDDLAYIIYTSGSTGVPKGVMIQHAAALNTIEDVNERFGVTADDRVLALSAMNFDLSVYDVFGLLSVGGAIVVPEPTAHREPERWATLVAEHRVTLWNSVPTLLGMFTEHALAQERAASLPLRLVMMSGDWIPVSLPGRIRELLPDAAVWSLGGATEASIWSILHPIDRVDPGWASIPYGKPMRNQQLHVLNEAMQPCPVWVPGHLYIAGVGLARGYLGDEAKTRAAFIRHPATGERLYRTGDLGRYLPDGNIEFLGREDFQVKIQGHRVELGEVEAALLQCPGVRAAVASAVGERQGAKRLVAYVVLDSDSHDVPADLLHSLRQTLPEYLVPQQVIVIGAVPLTENGKVDRAALPASGGPTGAVDTVTPPRDDVEVALARIWGEFFDALPLGVDTSFFDLGGDSLLAVRLMAQIRQRLGRSLPLSTLFAHPTIRHLAAVLRTAAGETRRSALVPIRSAGTKPLLVFVHPVGGDVLCYAELAAFLGDEQPFYAVQLPDTDPPLGTVPELAAHYVDAIITAIPDGPYRVGGWSMGACVALEMAQQLARAGKVVDLVALVDITEPPGARRGQPVDDAVLLSWFARDLAGLTGVEWGLPLDVMRARNRPLEVLYDEARSAGVLPEDIDLDTLARIVERFSRNFHALLAYEPQPYSGRVLFVRGTDSAPLETAKAWMALFPGDAELVEVAGDHYTLMRPPRVGAVARAFDAAVNRERRRQ